MTEKPPATSEESPTLELPAAPPPDAPPLAWAHWYRSLGYWPLPVRDAADLAGWLERLRETLISSGRTAEEADEICAKRAKSARKSTFVGWQKMRTPPTPAQIARWWKDRPERGIVLLTGERRGLCVIDVDTAKGGTADPWIESCTAIAETPSGGVHLVFAEADVRSTVGELAVGVDTRGHGGLIAAPAGSASPGRRWRTWGPLAPFPAEVAARLASGTPRLAGGVAVTPVEDLDEELEGLIIRPSGEERSFAAALNEVAEDGEKHRKAAAIVGMLARPRPLPRDAVDAALKLLRDRAEAQGYSLELHRALERAWREALEASSRSLAFVHEVLSTWNAQRARGAWDSLKVEQTAAGLWRTATQREEAAQAAAAPAGDLDSDLDALLPALADIYTPADFARDRRRGLLSIAVLPPWANHTGEIDRTIETGHGVGEFLDAALGGGLTPGYFTVLGADQAKGGKSAFWEQVIAGLALHSAAVLARATSGPVVIPYPVTEMWQGGEAGKPPPPARQLAHRQLARWLGVDGNLFRRGDETGGQAPGVRRLAEQLDRDPTELALEILATAQRALAEGPFHRAAQIVRPVNVRWLASSYDQAEGAKGPPVDHRRGVPFLRSITAAILEDRKRRAERWKIPESEIWPLLFIDPIQRFQAGGDNAVSALDEFVEELRAIADEHGFVVVATSDTNKDSAKGGVPKDATPFARAAWVFRGSYKLLHLPDSALVLSVDWSADEKTKPHARVWVALNRWGAPTFEPAHYHFMRETGRYLPLAGPPIAAESFDVDEEEEAPPQPRVKGGRFGKKKGRDE